VSKLNFEKALIKERQCRKNLLFYKTSDLFLCRKLILRKHKVDFEKPFKELIVLELTTLVRGMR